MAIGSSDLTGPVAISPTGQALIIIGFVLFTVSRAINVTHASSAVIDQTIWDRSRPTRWSIMLAVSVDGSAV